MAEDVARQTQQPDLYRLSQWVAAGQIIWRSLPLHFLKPVQSLLQSEDFAEATFAELEDAHRQVDEMFRCNLSGGYPQTRCWAAASARTAQLLVRRSKLQQRRCKKSADQRTEAQTVKRARTHGEQQKPQPLEDAEEPLETQKQSDAEGLPKDPENQTQQQEQQSAPGRCYYDLSRKQPVLMLYSGRLLRPLQTRETDVVEGFFEGQGWRRTAQPASTPEPRPLPPSLHTDWAQT
ncbi:MAG: hypothetical protein GY772_00200, partial [bacterium]|nr:hypothetical protein [bacterium]